MITKQYLQLQDIYAENCDASGNLTTLYPAIGLGVKGNYQVGILNASALDTSGVESWMFAIGQDFDADTHILYENSNVSYEVNGTSGLFTVSGMQGTRTDDMVEWIGDQETPTVVGELIGMGSDHNKNKPVALVQWRMFMRNRVDPEGEEPSVVPNYATVDDLENLVHKKTTIPDTEFALNEEDGDSYTEVAYEQIPDFAYFTIPSGLSATKVENEDAYMLNGMFGVSANFNTSEQTDFVYPVKLERKESIQEGVAEYSASGRMSILNIGPQQDVYTSTFNFDLQGLEDGTVVDGGSVPQWLLTVGKERTAEVFDEILRYYAPRNTQTENLLIPVSGGEFTGDISLKQLDKNYSYQGTGGGGQKIVLNGSTIYAIASHYDVSVFPISADTLSLDGFGRTVRISIRPPRQVWQEYPTLYFHRIPNTDDFEWYGPQDSIFAWEKFVLEKSGDDYIWKTYFAQAPERKWEQLQGYDDETMPGFNPFKSLRYTHTSGEVFENGIYDGRQATEPIPYYVTTSLVGTSASVNNRLVVPSAIDVETDDTGDFVFLHNCLIERTTGANGSVSNYKNLTLKRIDDGVYTASGNFVVDYFYNLQMDSAGASLDVTYTSGGNFYSLTTLTGNTEEREKPTYLPYLTYSEFSYEDEVQSLTTDSGNLTIYDNPWKQPDYLRAKVLLPGNRVWEGTLPRYANTGTYLRSSFIYEGLAIFRIGVSVASTPPNYIIAYDSGGESGDWDIPQEFGTHRFIPTSGGTFTGAISASDNQPYATSGYYEGLIQSKIDNPIYAGDNYSMVASLVTNLGNFSPFGGSDVILEMIYGPFNESSLGTIATRELKVSNSEVSANWHINEFNWLHAPITISEPGSTHYYYITARLKVTSTDPFELMDPSLWTLDCWKID